MTVCISRSFTPQVGSNVEKCTTIQTENQRGYKPYKVVTVHLELSLIHYKLKLAHIGITAHL